MQAQIRIYTINRGEMDAFLEHFEKYIRRLHKDVDWDIVSAWVNRPQNEFIWVRTYKDADDLAAKTKAFLDRRTELGITLGANVAKMEIREVESA
jgi:hypothetical protein